MLNYKFSNGLEIPYSSNRVFDQIIKTNALNNVVKFGVIASTYLELKLSNTDGNFNTNTFKNQSIDIYDEDVKKTTVYIESVKEKNKMITIKAYDGTNKFNKTWTPCITPITLYEFINDICLQCGIVLNTSILTNAGFVIQNIDALKGKTCRECLSYAAELTGNYVYLDENEQLCFKWFNFAKAKNIDINRLVNYDTDYENSVVDNIYFVRGSNVFSTNLSPKGSIFLTKDNPLLINSSSEKIQSILENISNKTYMEFLPCSISVADFFTYNIGDVVSFVDYKGNKRNAIIGAISYSGYNSCKITSTTVDEQDIKTSETEYNLSNNTTTVSSGGISFYRKVDDANIIYKECSEITEIQYLLNFNVDEVQSGVQVVINNNSYKTYKVHQGTNTICFMIKGKDMITSDVLNVEIMTANNLTDIELNTIYRDCLVIDYSEEDSEFNCGIKEIAIPSLATEIYGIKFYAGIEGWTYETTDTYEKLYWGEIRTQDTDNKYHPMLYNPIRLEKYRKLKQREFYLKLNISGRVYASYNAGWEYSFNNAIPNGDYFIYAIKNLETNEMKYYTTNTGIVKIKDNESVIVLLTKHYFPDTSFGTSVNEIKITATILDEDIGYFGVNGNKLITIEYVLGDDKETVYTFEGNSSWDETVYYDYPSHLLYNNEPFKLERGDGGSTPYANMMVCEPYAITGYKNMK